jgi:predicted TIM-barrel fold metal-dependent hydrolase
LIVNDVHCHFFSSRFLEILTHGLPDLPADGRAAAAAARLGWTEPGSPEELADCWAAELDRHHVARAALIASVPGDEESVVRAVARHPKRFVGFFMFNPLATDAEPRLGRALGEQALRCVCLFPALHGYSLDDERVGRVFAAAAEHKAAVFVHCGVLTIGARAKLGLPSAFDVRLGDPLAVAARAAANPSVPVILPHFGAGFFREALMAAAQCSNVYLDTSSSNSWMKYYPGLTLDDVFRRALDVAGPERILFGTDSSFFPRGWQRPVFEAQQTALAAARASATERKLIVGGNFDRLFPTEETRTK